MMDMTEERAKESGELYTKEEMTKRCQVPIPPLIASHLLVDRVNDELEEEE